MHEEHVEILIGDDGSVVIRNIMGGEIEARELVARFIGQAADDRYRRAGLWDWVRFEPGAVPAERLAALRRLPAEQSLEVPGPDGPREAHIRKDEVAETPRFDLPRMSFVREHEGRSWWKPLAVAAGLAVIVLIAVQIRLAQGPAYRQATFGQALAALETPAARPGLGDRIRRDYGDQFAVGLDQVLMKLRDGAVFKTADGRVWLAQAPGMGDYVKQLVATRSPLLLDTSAGPAGKARYVDAGGRLVGFEVIPLETVEPQAGYTVVADTQDPRDLRIGGRYAIEGGIRIIPAGTILYSPTFSNIRHAVRLEGIPARLRGTLLRNVEAGNLAVMAYGTLAAQGAPDTARESRTGKAVKLEEVPVTATLEVEVLRVSPNLFVKM